MSDERRRGLEKALAAGDEAARAELARALLREGAALQALELVAAAPAPSLALAAMEQEAWRAALARLRPMEVAGELPVDARPRPIAGWAGGGRYLVFALMAPTPGLSFTFGVAAFDHETWTVEVLARPEEGEEVADLQVGDEALFGRRQWGGDRDRLVQVGPPGRWSTTSLARRGYLLSVEPNGGRALLRTSGGISLEHLTLETPPVTLPSSAVAARVVCDWRQGRLAMLLGERLYVLPLDELSALDRASAALDPALAEVDALALLGDGRLIGKGTPRSLLIDLDRGEVCPLPAERSLEGASWAWDGRALLGGGHAREPDSVRLPTGAPPAPLRSTAAARCAPGWHPRADVSVWRHREGFTLRTAAGGVVAELGAPSGLLVGWTRDGRTLLGFEGRRPVAWTID